MLPNLKRNSVIEPFAKRNHFLDAAAVKTFSSVTRIATSDNAFPAKVPPIPPTSQSPNESAP